MRATFIMNCNLRVSTTILRLFEIPLKKNKGGRCVRKSIFLLETVLCWQHSVSNPNYCISNTNTEFARADLQEAHFVIPRIFSLIEVLNRALPGRLVRSTFSSWMISQSDHVPPRRIGFSENANYGFCEKWLTTRLSQKLSPLTYCPRVNLNAEPSIPNS